MHVGFFSLFFHTRTIGLIAAVEFQLFRWEVHKTAQARPVEHRSYEGSDEQSCVRKPVNDMGFEFDLDIFSPLFSCSDLALSLQPIMFRGEVRLNVEEKKTRAVRERETRGGGDDRRDMRRNDRGPGGSRSIVGSGMMRERDGRGPPPRGGMAPKPGMGSGRGSGGPGEGRFTTQRR